MARSSALNRPGAVVALASLVAVGLGRSAHPAPPATVPGANAVAAAAVPSVAATDQELPLRRFTALGEAAEVYFSPDGRSLVGTARREGDPWHRAYTAAVDGSWFHRLNDRGHDACSYYFPDGQHVVWTSTRDHPELREGSYSDPLDYPQGAELYVSRPDGSEVRRLTNNLQYDAEVSVSPDGRWVLFTRQVDGKLDLWRIRPDGTGEEPITRTDDWQEGGAFYLPDSETILYRAWKKADDGVRGRPMTIFTIRHDGTGPRQVTHDPGTNWAPHPAPDGRHFAYVRLLPPGNFELFLGDLETGESRRLTWNDAFDGFPAFSPDGRTLVFASGRDAAPGTRRLEVYFMDVSSLGLGAPKTATATLAR